MSFLCQQLAVGALLNDPAVLDHCNDVCSLYSRQAVSNDYAGSTLPCVIKSFLDDLHTDVVKMLLAPGKPSLVISEESSHI